MGFIYKLTSPSGKSYIGQTIREDYEKRLNQHKNAAYREDDHGCVCLYRAIRKYEWNNFTVEILHECENSELNNLEIKEIAEHNTLYPNGYNISKGGAGCVYAQTIETKEKRSKSLRKNKDIDLPMYVKPRKTKFGTGYLVEKPGFPPAQFCLPDQTDEEKLMQAIDYITNLNNGVVPKKRLQCQHNLGIDLPHGIHYVKRNDGFVVEVDGHKTKYFTGKTETRERKLERAYEYFNSITNINV